MITIIRKYQIEAAHRLPLVPDGHKCKRLHGHSFQIEIIVRGEPDQKMGWLIDYWDLDKKFEPLFDQLDHRFLNEIPGLENPTSEILARWIYERLKPDLAILREVKISETCMESCTYSE